MRRLLVLTITLLVLAAAAGPATARKKALPTLIFPVVGGATYWQDDYGDPRPQGSHQGNDLMAPRNTPVVAVEAGVIKTHVSGRGGLMLYLRSKTREYLYIHLSNDRTDQDDNSGGPATAFAPGIRDGVRVRAGQHIGFVGDSGDAAGIAPHLHFEERLLNGRSVNPRERLLKANVVAFAGPAPGAAEAEQQQAITLRGASVSLDLEGRVAWVAATPDGSNRLALRLERMGVTGGERFDSQRLVMLTATPEAVAAAEAVGVGARVAVTTSPAAPSLARQALRAGSWQAAVVVAAPAERRG